MRVSGSIAAIAASALLLAGGLVVRAVATSIAGPLLVTDSADAYAIRGYGTRSSGNIGVEGTSSSGNGVLGLSKSTTHAGVFGANSATAGYGVKGTSATFGVVGVSKYIGVQGTTTSGLDVGVQGDAGNSAGGDAIDGSGFAGIFGTGNSKDSSSTGVTGAIDGSEGVAVGATTEGNGALAMDAYSTHAGGYVMSLDQYGNMILEGSITTSSSPLVVVRGRGAPHAAYASENAAPAIEDTGEGRIVSGAGFVAIDPAFVDTLDRHAAYEVFVTPEGDCRGLYVGAAGPRGFYVRELMGGRSSVAFAYRVVGHPASTHAPRLPLYTDPLAHRAPHAR